MEETDRTVPALSFFIICPHPTPASLKKNKQQCGEYGIPNNPMTCDQAISNIILSGLIWTGLFRTIHFDPVHSQHT